MGWISSGWLEFGEIYLSGAVSGENQVFYFRIILSFHVFCSTNVLLHLNNIECFITSGWNASGSIIRYCLSSQKYPGAWIADNLYPW